MTITRRSILVGIAVAAAARPTVVLAQPVLRRARTYGTTAPASIQSYKRAVLSMLALPPTDLRNWYRQALIHILDCPHSNWWFLPWHRGYLSHFEKICAQQSGDADFRLPYWDWSASASVPLVLFDDELNPANPRFVAAWNDFRNDLEPAVRTWWSTLSPSRLDQLANRKLNSADDVLSRAMMHFESGHGRRSVDKQHPQLDARGAAVTKEAYIRAAMSPARFEDFASGKTAGHSDDGSEGPLESGPHDNVHGFTGGFMQAFLSPIDPIFWLHHANLDRLWDIWSRKQKAKAFADLPTGAELARLRNEPFLFFCDENQMALDKTAGDCLDISASYEPGTFENLAAAAPAVAVAAPREVVATGLLNRALKISLETSAAVAISSTLLPEIVQDENKELFAKITVTPPPDPQDVHVRVYINCPYLSRATPVDDVHYVGTITFFAASHHQGSGPSTFTLPLGPALDGLHSKGILPKSAIKVQLLTDGPAGKPLENAALNEVSIEAQ